MKPITTLLIITTAYFLSSCGQSSEQKALAEKQKTDSLIAATADSVKKATEDSVQIANGLEILLKTKSLVKDAIPFIQSKVEEAKTSQTNVDAQMANIESFHFLRTTQDKQTQISNEAKIQQSVNNRLDGFETIQKIFRLAYDEMDGIEYKKFNSLGEFISFKVDLAKRINGIQRKTIDESNSPAQLDNFSFYKTIYDVNFVNQVNDYKMAHPGQ